MRSHLLIQLLAALSAAAARPQSPVRPLHLTFSNKRGTAAANTRSLALRGGGMDGVNACVQQPRPRTDAMDAALAVRGGQLPIVLWRAARILPRLLAIVLPALGGYSNIEKFDLVGIALFAYVGTIAGGKSGMDLFGCMMMGTVTATGGGTIRDIVLGADEQVFWMRDPTYLKICIVTSFVTFFVWPRFEKRGARDDGELLCFVDALGMGAFCVMGADKALKAGSDPLCAAILGLVTATFGGVTRDVLTRRPVRIFHATIDGRKKTLYALPALMGSSLYVTLRTCCDLKDDVAASCAFVTTVLMRVAAYTYRLALPEYPHPVWRDGRRL